MSTKQEKEHLTHNWYARLRRESQPVLFEFGSPISKAEAERRIAKMHGMKNLPSEAVVSWRELEKLDPKPDAKEQTT